MNEYYLGIDVGNTKTHYLLSDGDGSVKANWIGPGANHQEIPEKQTVDTLTEGLDQIKTIVGLSHIREIKRIYVGAAGADTDEDFKNLNRLYSSIFQGVPFSFENDGILGLKNGVENNIGLVITCGTGNTNFSINSKGEVARIGGLTDHLGDVLGASMIAFATTSAAVRSYDGRDYPSILPEMICRELAVDNVYELINLELSSDTVKRVVETLFEAGEKGDGKALELIWDFTKEILRITEHFSVRMFPDEKFRLVLDGPVFKSRYKPFKKMIELAVNARYKAEIIIPDTPPVFGALYFALEQGGISLSDKLVRNIHQSFLKLEDI